MIVELRTISAERPDKLSQSAAMMQCSIAAAADSAG
jgi:hypothetical protein